MNNKNKYASDTDANNCQLHRYAFYGRVKTRSLTERKQAQMQHVLQRFGISGYADCIDTRYNAVALEIGFGDGAHLYQIASHNPTTLFIGADPFVNGIAHLSSKIIDNGIQNIRIYNGDARVLLSQVPEQSIESIYLLFPDPWPKRKHHTRRFVQDDTLEEMHRVIKQDGILRIASDHQDYAKWIRSKLLAKHNILFDVDIFNERPDINLWPVTKYEQKATTEIMYASCKRLQ